MGFIRKAASAGLFGVTGLLAAGGKKKPTSEPSMVNTGNSKIDPSLVNSPTTY